MLHMQSVYLIILVVVKSTINKQNNTYKCENIWIKFESKQHGPSPESSLYLNKLWDVLALGTLATRNH